MARTRAWHRRARADLWLWAGAMLVGAWGLLYPLPYGLCVLALGAGASTFLALPFASPRRFPLLKKNGMLGTSPQIAVIFAFLLAMRALLDFNLVDWFAPAVAAVGAGLLLAALAARAARRADPPLTRTKASGGAIALFLMGLGLGWGVAVQATVLLDHSEPMSFRLRVEEKWITHGRIERHHVRLAPRIEELGGIDFRVDPGVYGRASVGDELCVELRRGFLAFRWYEVITCSGPAS